MSKQEKSIVVNTMQIADMLKCQHHKIMKRLETYLKRHPEHKADIILTQYEVGTGRFYKMYDLTQKGLQIYLKMRYEDAGRNSPQTMAGLQQLGKLIKEEEPLIGEASDPGSNVLPKDQGRTQIAGVDELYQLYRDRANTRPDPSNVRIPEEECERWARNASINGEQEWSRIMESVYEYGDSRELNGYRAGFNMAFQIVIGLITFGAETAKC